MRLSPRLAALFSAAALTLLACGLGGGGGRSPAAPAAPAPAARVDGSVTLNADGSFSPPVVRVKAGQSVTWQLGDRGASVVAGTPGAACPVAPPWSPNVLAGPSPLGPGGLYVLAPFADERTGAPAATLPATWASPDITGVHVRLRWKDVEPARGRFDLSQLERDLDRAVASGKLVSLSINAGSDGTPDWIFQEGVERLHFRDAGSKSDKCGKPMDLGDPTDAAYRELWGELLEQVAARVRSRADWFRAIAYVRVGGANLFSNEARLPNRCTPGCDVCNTEVWAKAGYRPSKLVEFYDWQAGLLADRFPDKALSLMLIQAGFPRVNEQGCWLVGEDEAARTACADGTSRAGTDTLPGGTDTTEAIIERMLAKHGSRFQIEHNGLSPGPRGGRCPTYQQHPARGPYRGAPNGCPNKWVLQAGARAPDQLTGFQTNNEEGVGTPAELDSALQSAWDNSDAVAIEIYESMFTEASRAGALPSGRTLADWDRLFRERRSERTSARMPEPFPRTFTWTVPRGMAPGKIHYFDPAACAPGSAKHGTIVIDP